MKIFLIAQVVFNIGAVGAFIFIIRWQKAQQEFNNTQMKLNANFALEKIK